MKPDCQPSSFSSALLFCMPKWVSKSHDKIGGQCSGKAPCSTKNFGFVPWRQKSVTVGRMVPLDARGDVWAFRVTPYSPCLAHFNWKGIQVLPSVREQSLLCLHFSSQYSLY